MKYFAIIYLVLFSLFGINQVSYANGPISALVAKIQKSESIELTDLDADVLKAINEKDDVTGQTVLNALIKANKPEYNLLVEKLIDPDSANPFKDKVDINGKGIQNSTPLITAIRTGNEDLVIKLIDANPGKIDLAAENTYGSNALMWAARMGLLSVVKKITSLPGGDVYMSNKKGSNALLWASRWGNKEVLEHLLSLAPHQAKVNEKNIWNRTPLYWAVKSEDPIKVAGLIQKRAEVVIDELPNRATNTQIKSLLEIGQRSDLLCTEMVQKGIFTGVSGIDKLIAEYDAIKSTLPAIKS